MPGGTPSVAAEKRALRERMRSSGLGMRAIAAEFGRRYGLRPRAAWREAHGWSLAEASGRINSFRGDVGLDPSGACSMTASHLSERESWPGAGNKPTGRRPTPYMLAVLARVYGCSVADLVDLADRERTPAPDLLVIDSYEQRSAPTAGSGQVAVEANRSALPGQSVVRAEPQRIAPGGVGELGPIPAYRWMQEHVTGGLGVEREVLMTVHESSDHAERAERRDVGEATLEQLHADVTRLSGAFMTDDPFPVFREMRRVRNRMYAVLERQVWPRDQAELYFLLAATNALMSAGADDLGYRSAAEELARAGWAYAVVIDHRPAMAFLRLHLSRLSYPQRPRQSRDLATSALEYLAEGPTAAYAHLMYGRAMANLGDADAARRAIATASEVREREYHDELLEIGGEFDLSRASQHYLGGTALLEVPSAEADAISELEQAAALYAAGPGPGETHGFGMRALTQIDLATARLRLGELDAAADALATVLALASSQRIAALPERLEQVRAELSRPRYRSSTIGGRLAQQIEDFSEDTIGRELHELPLGPS